MTEDTPHPFQLLTPDLILDAMESVGYFCDGRVHALNSYENRVFQIGQEDSGEFLIAKFYRPGRWSLEQIQEEHQFSQQLMENDIPVVAPYCIDGKNVFQHKGFYFSAFPMKGGRPPELADVKYLQVLGRLLARLHNVGESTPFSQRPELNWHSFGKDCIDYVSEQFIPYEFKSQYDAITQDLEGKLQHCMSHCRMIRTHGDLHIGNIIVRDDSSYLVDLDDSRMAPSIQDIWMLLSGDLKEQTLQLNHIIPAYEEFRPFPRDELKLIEPLRTLRMIHHCAWLARRWEDPAFEPAFPWFDTHAYWQTHIHDLQQQSLALDSHSFDHL